jgi:hypothetical protein
VRLVFAAKWAEFAELQPVGRGLLVLRVGIVPVLALAALKRDDLARHGSLSSIFLKTLEPMTRIELVTSSLPRTRSTN